MSYQDDQQDRNNSLLRRMLDQDHEAHGPEEDQLPDPERPITDGPLSPIPGLTSPAGPDDGRTAREGPLSPIRPSMPNEVPPAPPIPPTLPTSQNRQLTPREQMQQAEEALIQLREKMSEIAAQFAKGQLNRDQFEAIYGRYSEQRDIAERLLMRDPESQAWQSVIRSGQTGFLMDHYAARVKSYAIYDQTDGTQIAVSGTFQIDSMQASALLERLRVVIAQRGNPGPAKKMLKDAQCVLIVPGELSVAIVIYSRVPSERQIERVEDLHRDFERANQRALRRRDYSRNRLVFPHRALMEA